MRLSLSAALVIASLMGTSPADARQQQPALAAQYQNGTVTLADVEKSAAADLLSLEVQREKILQTHLDRMAASLVLALEAKARGLTETELVEQEVIAKVQEPTTAEIESYYQASRDLMKESQDKAVPKIRQALTAQRRQQVYLAYLESLKTKYQFKSLLEPVRVAVDASAAPARGPVTAPVTIVEFSDFECAYCAALSRTLADLTKQYGDSVRVVFRNFPLERIHPNAMKAAEVAACAADQGKFWDLHDALFKGGALSAPEIAKRAAGAGVDADQLQACMSAGKGSQRVHGDVEAGLALNISSTPSFFINGRPLRGAVPRDEIARVIDEELRAAREARGAAGGHR